MHANLERREASKAATLKLHEYYQSKAAKRRQERDAARERAILAIGDDSADAHLQVNLNGTDPDASDAGASELSEDETGAVMVNYDMKDEDEAPETLSRLSQVKVPWDGEDVEYWFTELENQMELYNTRELPGHGRLA